MPQPAPVSAALDPAAIFPFPLDDFQLEAIDALNQGHSVVVSAPTGSGKTLAYLLPLVHQLRREEQDTGARAKPRRPPRRSSSRR